MNWLRYLIGFIVGANLGVVVGGLLCAAKGNR